MYDTHALHHPSDLGARLKSLFDRVERERRELEERWLQDLRQYKCVYDPEVESRLHPKRSRAFLRMTRMKVRTLDSRIIDILFPVGGEANWAVEPTPLPEITEELVDGLRGELRALLGREPEEQDVRAAVLAEAKRAARRMGAEMADQLADIGYSRIMRSVIHSGHLYGTGVLKGPLVRPRPSDDTGTPRPYIEFVPIWDIYPDMDAVTIDDARFVMQRRVMSAHELRNLADRPDFDGQAVLDHLAASPRGDAAQKTHESELKSLGGYGGGDGSRDQRFEVLEYWGMANGSDLASWDPDFDGELDREHPAVVWLLGSTVIKAQASPFADAWLPYHFYYFEKDETSVFGEGAAAVMRDPQLLMNAAVRAMLDNAAVSAGPQLEVNQDLLLEHEDVTDVQPFRIWLRRGMGADAGYPAVRATTLPSHTQEFMAMAEMFERYMNETIAVPDQTAVQSSRGAGTVRGLSMLLSAASSTLKDHVRLFDEGVTKPFITALYKWNMLFNAREDVKGDFCVRAKGLSSLMAKEIHVEHLDMFAAGTANALDAPFINRAELLRRMAAARDLGPGIVKSDEELSLEMETDRS